MKNLRYYSDLYRKMTTGRASSGRANGRDSIVEHTASNVDELDDDIYFFVNGAIPVAASEIFDAGDFC